MSLYLKEVGPRTAPTIVFLHGLGVSSWMWEDQLAVLQTDYHCLAIDLPGNGESYGTNWHSFSDAVRQVADIIRTHSVSGKAHVVGLSLGGYLALFLLQEQPEVVESVIVSGVTSRPLSQQWLWKTLFKIMPTVLKWEVVIKLSAKMMQLPPEATALYRRDSQRLSSATYQRVYDEVLNFSLPVELGERQHRLLAVAGDKEVKSIKNSLADFPKRLPNASTSLVPNAHHGWNGEHPQLFTNMVRAWVEGQALPKELATARVATPV